MLTNYNVFYAYFVKYACFSWEPRTVYGHYLLFTRRRNFRLPKLKAITDNKINVTQKLKLDMNGWYHCGKTRKCLLPEFSVFPTVFSRFSFTESLKKRVKCDKLNFYNNLLDRR